MNAYQYSRPDTSTPTREPPGSLRNHQAPERTLGTHRTTRLAGVRLARVAHLASTALEWLCAGQSDPRPGNKRGQWALELRYTVFVVRGLLRVHCADPKAQVEVDAGTDLMRSMADRLERLGENHELVGHQRFVQELVRRTVPLARGEAGKVELPDGCRL